MTSGCTRSVLFKAGEGGSDDGHQHLDCRPFDGKTTAIGLWSHGIDHGASPPVNPRQALTS